MIPVQKLDSFKMSSGNGKTDVRKSDVLQKGASS